MGRRDAVEAERGACAGRRLYGRNCRGALPPGQVLVNNTQSRSLRPGLASQVCKNITLAGVGSLTLVDDTPCAEAPPGCFLVPHDTAPDARCAHPLACFSPSMAACIFCLIVLPCACRVADACAATLSEMNPFVKVSALHVGQAAIDAARLKGSFDIVVASGLPFPALLRLNDECRAAGVNLFATTVWESHGFFFADLGDSHLVLPPPKKIAPDEKPGDAPPPQQGPPKTLAYVPISAAIAAPLETLPKNLNGTYMLLRAAYSVEQATTTRLRPGDTKAFCLAGAALSACAAACTASVLTSSSLEAFVAGCTMEMPAISAVVGGVLANDMLKTISGVGEPAHNFFFFDSHSMAGTLDRIACPAAQ